ncbi:MAG TPA: dihydropteroate synthase [Halothiobacillus sp.]|nr:dihydropteroate synthase [Halothiobacillus sp.]
MGRLATDPRPLIMGILNVTPDSFSDGGRFFLSGAVDVDQVVAVATQMVEEGADILDIGGESTRPGAASITTEQELMRVVPVIEALVRHLDVPLSVDSSDPLVMTEAVRAGAVLINDVRALARPGALAAAAAAVRDHDVSVCLMHMRGEPGSMSDCAQYTDLVAEVKDELLARIQQAVQMGIPTRRLIVDPGFGFAKTTTQNMQILKHLSDFKSLGFPLLVGLSRKRMIGEITGRAVSERVAGSVALALLAVERGARIVRVHDVAATRDVLRLFSAMRDA